MSAIHSATSPELTALRSHNQAARLGVVFPKSNVIWQGLINQATFDAKYLTELTWDTQTGAFANILPGMTLWIGSEAGGYDKAQLRVRKAASATKVFFDPVSGLDLLDNLFLTVVDDFETKGRHFGYTATPEAFADLDVDYTNQNSTKKPVVVMGGPGVVELIEGAGSYLPRASDSWLPGGTITAYLWTCAGAASITGNTTATPTVNFNAPGTYLLVCRVTGSNAVQAYGYRKVVVYDETEPPLRVKIDSLPYGSRFEGGFEAIVRCYDNFALEDVQPGAAAILFSTQSFFDAENQFIGQSFGNENVRLAGWVSEEGIQTDEHTGEAYFTIRGYHWKLKNAPVQAFQVDRTIDTPTKWEQLLNPTVVELYWQLIVWRSTLAETMDCYPPVEPGIYPGLDGAKGTIWEQLYLIGQRTFCMPGVDIYGRLFFEVDAEMLSDTDKDALTEVMEVTQEDRASARIENINAAQVSAVYLSSIMIVLSEKKPRTVYSVSPGLVEGAVGSPITVDALANSQEESNSKAGRYYSARNNNQLINLQLPQDNVLIGLFPNQVVQVDVAANETPREALYSGRMLPGNIRYVYDEESGAITTEISGKYLVPEGPSADGIIPVSDGAGGLDTDLPDFNLPSFTPDFQIPAVLLPEVPELPAFPNDAVVPSMAFILYEVGGLWYTDEWGELDPHWWSANEGLPDLEELGGDLLDFIITPDRHIYVRYTYAVYWATLDELVFRPLFDRDFLRAEYPGGVVEDQQICAGLGFDPSQPNYIAAFLGSGYLGTQIGHIWTGDHTGLSKGAEATEWPTSGVGTITVGDGMWVVTTGTGSSSIPATTHFSLDGGSEIASETSGDLGRMHSRGDSGHRIYMYPNDLDRSDDNGLTPDELSINVEAQFTYQVAVSPGGRLMALSDDDTYRSPDGGDTWELCPSQPGEILGFNEQALWCIDEDNWVVAGREPGGLFSARPPYVYYTDDFGESWFPAYGNLPVLLPDVDAGPRKVIVV